MISITTPKTIGWDIGGAHVKAAVLNSEGQMLRVLQQPCPLWKGVSHLHQALSQMLQTLGNGPCRHALTMTGELVDCFTSREQGVFAIIEAMHSHCQQHELLIFAGEYGLLPVAGISHQHIMAIASTNWLVSAQLVAKHCPNALFVDMGSTTTDILTIANHTLQAQGYTDYQRLISGELLYTGAIRTAVMAIAQRAVFKSQEMGLMAEYFATTADVYRVTGDLQEAHDQAETADGAEKTPLASARRLSRLTGYEFDPADWCDWLEFAQQLKTQQKQLVSEALLLQSKSFAQSQPLTLVAAGVGRFLLKEIAAEQGWIYRDFDSFFAYANDDREIDAADCAPAAALACLAKEFA
jgi:probable H4MPT-linked C1 transfer pathway protein